MKSDFAKNVVWVSLGTLFAQFMNVLFSPIITRLFTPEEFGAFMVYNSLLGMLLVVGSLKYESSIPISDNKVMAVNAIALSAYILVLISLIIAIIFLIFKTEILILLDTRSLGNHLFFVPLGLLLAGIYTILLQWALRTKNFKQITHTKIYQGLGQNISQVALGLVKFGGLGLIFGHIIGRFSGSFALYKRLKQNEPLFYKLISLKKMRWIFRRYKHFAIITLPSQLLSKGGLELPVFFITSLFGAGVVGQYGLANMIVNLPVVLLGIAIGDVFYAEAACTGRVNPKKLLALSNKLIKRLILLGLIPTIILLIFGPFLFTFIFGEEWRPSGTFAQILAVLAFFRLVFNPVSRVFIAFERHLLALLTNSLRIVFVLLAFLFVYLFDLTAFETVILYAISMCFVYVFMYILSRKVINDQIKINKEK